MLHVRPVSGHRQDCSHRSLSGEWLLGFTCNGDKITFAPNEANQVLRPSLNGVAAFERLVGGGWLGLVKTEGTYKVMAKGERRESGGNKQSNTQVLQLQFSVERSTMGPVPLPLPPSSTEEVLLLDETLCVVRTSPANYAIWVRPSMQVTQKGEQEY